MDKHLGDVILNEYMTGSSKTDIITKLQIPESTFNYWEKINKTELKRVDQYIEKQKLKEILKIKTVPIDSDDEDIPPTHHNKFFHKEPVVEKVVDNGRIIMIVNRKQQIQEKICKLDDLLNRKVIGELEYNKSLAILNKELNIVEHLL